MDLRLRRPLSPLEKGIATAVIFAPLLAALAYRALAETAPAPSTWLLFALCYSATVIGVTVGFHRLLTHRSFRATRGTKILLTCLGCMSLEGSPFFWVAAHRRHHRFSDSSGDPHSPHLHSNPALGFLHAHLGWMMTHRLEDWTHYIPDLLQDRDLVWIQRHYAWIALAGLLIPGILNAALLGTAAALVEGVLLCGFVRVLLQHHVTWSINSVCHRFGTQPYATCDGSRNNFWMALLSHGEGWHNNHHAFPSSARHGLEWWQLDVSYWVIRALKRLGLAWAVVLPSPRMRVQRTATPDVAVRDGGWGAG